jgi:hypothetical protein
MLILEIAAGVFLGACLLGLVFGVIPEWLRQREIDRRAEQASQARFVREMEELRRARPDLHQQVEDGRIALWQAQVHLRNGSSPP